MVTKDHTLLLLLAFVLAGANSALNSCVQHCLCNIRAIQLSTTPGFTGSSPWLQIERNVFTSATREIDSQVISGTWPGSGLLWGEL